MRVRPLLKSPLNRALIALALVAINLFAPVAHALAMVSAQSASDPIAASLCSASGVHAPDGSAPIGGSLPSQDASGWCEQCAFCNTDNFHSGLASQAVALPEPVPQHSVLPQRPDPLVRVVSPNALLASPRAPPVFAL